MLCAKQGVKALKIQGKKKNTTVSNSGEFGLQWCFQMVETGGLEPSTSCV